MAVRRPIRGALLLTILLALAGCLSPEAVRSGGDAPSGDEAPADWPERALPFGDGHDHADRAHHRGLSTPNFRVLGFDPLATDYHGTGAGGYFCGGVGERDERTLAVVNSFTSDAAIVIADVTDPAAPQKLGELVLPRTMVYDADVSPDARWAVLATTLADRNTETDRATGADASALRPFFRDACTGEETPVGASPSALAALAARSGAGGPENEVPYASGVVLVDLADPTAPVVADYRPLPVVGAHSAFVTEVDGTTFVLASVVNLAHTASYFAFYTVADSPAGGRLMEHAVYRPIPAPEESIITNGHVDGWIQKHPITGATLAYLADWNGGLAILDIGRPGAPLEVGRWRDENPNHPPGAIHDAYPIGVLWGEKHYTIVGQEVVRHPKHTPTGVVSVLDTTDPSNPTVVGAWTLPVDVEWEKIVEHFSTHYIAVVDRTLFVAMYHGGLWAVDLADPATPRSAGAFIPDIDPPTQAATPDHDKPGGFNAAPYVLDVIPLPGGNLVTWDAHGGLYTLAYDATRPAPRVVEWFDRPAGGA